MVTMSSLQRMLMKLWLLCGIMLATSSLEAATQTVGDYKWTYHVHHGKAEISNDGSAAISPSPTGGVTIPSMLGGYPVVRIGESAFDDCGDLTSVTIPDGVTDIDESAFDGCNGLTSISVAAGNDNYSSSNGLLLSKDGKTLIKGVNGDVTIPDGVTDIGESAFYGCSGLTGVTIPDSVTSIGEGAFYGCSGLANVTIGNGVTSIGKWAFGNCSSLTSFTVDAENPNYSTVDGLLLSKDGQTLVQGVNGDVVIPDGVTSIGDGAFFGYTGLTSIVIPSSVTSIGVDAFRSTTLAAVYVEEGDLERVTSLVAGAGGTAGSVTITDCVTTVNPVAPDPATSTSLSPVTGTAGSETTATTLSGAVYDGGDVIGIVALKLGKMNAKNKTCKVSGSVTTLDGKKYVIKPVSLTVGDGVSPVSASLDVTNLGTMEVTIGGSQFAGSLGSWHVQSANVGGDWTRSESKVHVDATSAFLPAGTLADLLPDGEPVVVSGGKWKFAKATSVKWAKPKKGAPLPEIYDQASGKGLIVDTSSGKTNLSGLKLTYTPKKGTFKGSFKVYALEGEGQATRLKKYTAKVSGMVVDGVGYGTATCKNSAFVWSVTVE